MKKPKTIKALLKLVKPTTDQSLIIDYTGKDPVVLGARAFLLTELIAKYFNGSETENYWWGWYKSGSCFSDSDYCYWPSLSSVSARLRFHKEEDFLYATKTFPEIYKTIMEA